MAVSGMTFADEEGRGDTIADGQDGQPEAQPPRPEVIAFHDFQPNRARYPEANATTAKLMICCVSIAT